MGLIYCATNKINGKKYIGQTSYSLEYRKRSHFRDARNRPSTTFHYALVKYGLDAFEWSVLLDDLDWEECLYFEKVFISKHNTMVPNGYNLTEGGMGGPPCKQGWHHTDETKKLLSDIAKNRSPETRQVYREARIRQGPLTECQLNTLRTNWIGRRHTEESIKLMREKAKEAQNRPEVKEKKGAAIRAYWNQHQRIVSEETKEKTRLAMVSRWKDPEYRAKVLAARAAKAKGAQKLG